MMSAFGPLALVIATLSAGSVIHVHDSATGAQTGASWIDAYVHLQDALNVAVAGDQVWVATGNYRPDQGVGETLLDPHSTFLIPSGVAVYGGFAGTETTLEARAGQFDQTILTGDLLGNDLPNFVGYEENAMHLVSLFDGSAATRLDGFTVIGGHARPALGTYGAGLYVVGGAPTIANCIVRLNQAYSPPNFGDARGAGLYSEAATLTLLDNTFFGNRAVIAAGDNQTASGGGALVTLGSVHILRTTFDSNFVSGGLGSDGYGGGMATFDAEVVMQDGAFTGNLAEGGMFADGVGKSRGGALMCDQGSLILEGVTLANNRVECRADPSAGGALYSHLTDPILRNCVFEGNISRVQGYFVDALGGAIYCADEDVWIEGCSFVNNRSVALGSESWAWGGAIFAGGGNPTLVSSRFIGNRTAVESGHGLSFGGAIYAAVDIGGAGELIASHCTFHANRAGTPGFGQGGAFNVSSMQLRLVNTILWANTDSGGTGQAAQIFSSMPPIVDRCCVMGWTGSLGGVGNFGTDPLFVDADGLDQAVGTADDDLRLRSGSPCIDAGDETGLPVDTYDADGDGNTLEKSPFDVAARPRRIDDPATVDGGVGVAPIGDMGAYESSGFYDANQNALQDDLEFCQSNLGFRGPGSTTLSVCGDALTSIGNAATFLVTGAPANTPMLLVLGTSVAPTPFFQGTLVPGAPLVVVAGLLSDPTGKVSAILRGGGGPPVSVAAQLLLQNGTVVEFSNALLAVSG